MSPRPRVASDEQNLAGAAWVITRVGPTKFTLKDVTKEARGSFERHEAR